MRIPRMTTRRWMLTVAIVAVTLALFVKRRVDRCEELAFFSAMRREDTCRGPLLLELEAARIAKDPQKTESSIVLAAGYRFRAARSRRLAVVSAAGSRAGLAGAAHSPWKTDPSDTLKFEELARTR